MKAYSWLLSLGALFFRAILEFQNEFLLPNAKQLALISSSDYSNLPENQERLSDHRLSYHLPKQCAPCVFSCCRGRRVNAEGGLYTIAYYVDKTKTRTASTISV
jgi:hypothetical protein